MLGGVPGESSELVGRWVAILEGRVSVRIFVRNHGEEEDRCDENELLELVQGRPREGQYPPRDEVT